LVGDRVLALPGDRLLIERALDLDVVRHAGLHGLLLHRRVLACGLGQACRTRAGDVVVELAQLRGPGQRWLIDLGRLARGRQQRAREAAVGLDLKVAEHEFLLGQGRERRTSEPRGARVEPLASPLHEWPRLLVGDEARERGLELIEHTRGQSLAPKQLLALDGRERTTKQQRQSGEQQHASDQQRQPHLGPAGHPGEPSGTRRR
jgi:hypothetical protein